MYWTRICNYRVSIEYPAGLVDKGETVEESALRELKEETGLPGKVVVSSIYLLLT